MGEMSPVQFLKTFLPRHRRGEIAMLSAPVCGLVRPRITPPGSEVRRVTLCVGRASNGSFIIHARALSLLGYSYYIIRGVLLEVVVPGYSPRQLRISPPCRSGHCPGCSSELSAPGGYRNFNPLWVDYYLIWSCRVALVVRHRRHISSMGDCSVVSRRVRRRRRHYRPSLTMRSSLIMHPPRLVIFSQCLQAVQHFVPRERPGAVVGEQVVYVG